MSLPTLSSSNSNLNFLDKRGPLDNLNMTQSNIEVKIGTK